MLHVTDIERSIRFYERLGFATVDTDRGTPLGWARLHCEGGAGMFLRAEHPMDPSAQALILYMYTPDLMTLRERLLASSVQVAPIQHPEYMPSGEMQFVDPDGYAIAVAHWGKTEHEAWERRIGANGPLKVSQLTAKAARLN
jgi:predicted enzyme related to lactoylglutathione lyase